MSFHSHLWRESSICNRISLRLILMFNIIWYFDSVDTLPSTREYFAKCCIVCRVNPITTFLHFSIAAKNNWIIRWISCGYRNSFRPILSIYKSTQLRFVYGGFFEFFINKHLPKWLYSAWWKARVEFRSGGHHHRCECGQCSLVTYTMAAYWDSMLNPSVGSSISVVLKKSRQRLHKNSKNHNLRGEN